MLSYKIGLTPTARVLLSQPVKGVFITGRNYSSVVTSTKNKDELDAKDKHPTLDLAEKTGKHDLYSPDKYQLSQAWKHPDFKMEEMKTVPVSHLEPPSWSDNVAYKILQAIRKSFDFVTGYRHPPPGKEMDPQYAMTENDWLRRFVFLESIAGVPGMVGGMLRHLHSLRLLRRDRAWIETLLEEAYNERMHLLTFIKLTKPGFMMRLMVLGAQGVFFNGFMLSYLLFPRLCHRFVGYLEEEAIITYTRCINDLERGQLPGFANKPAPDIAIQYWNMPKESTVKDLIYYVRADECKHREVNHTFANLSQKSDPNPYALDNIPEDIPHPTKDLKYHHSHPVGWKKNEIPL